MAKLIISELATNAILHARSEFVVHLELQGELFRLEVIDWGDGEPAAIDRPADQSGRGLRIVERLSSDWGWERRLAGKAVWCVVDLHEC